MKCRFLLILSISALQCTNTKTITSSTENIFPDELVQFVAYKSNPIKTVRLMFDGRDRIKTTPASTFTQLEPTKVHTNTPLNKYIHVYSFALEPEKIEQPNGTCNFSELQEPMLHLTFNPNIVASTLFVYAVNYNMLISKNGSGYLLHSLSKSVPTTMPDINCI
jgi:hypothetical protein